MNGSFHEQKEQVRAKLPGWVWALGLSLLVAFAIVLPFFWLGSASGHDFEFHVASWLDVSYQWREGTFYPRWTAWSNHGFGEPRFIFYPPLSWMLGATLLQVLPLPWVPMGFVLLTQTLAGLNAFFLLRRLSTERAALLGAACYAANPNALLMTYIRSDFAEQLACAIFPLVLLGALRILDLPGQAEAKRPSIVALGIPFALVWLANAPAGVIITYAITLVICWAALQQRSWFALVRGGAGMLLGFGLAGFYLLPAAYEQRWVNITQALSSGLLPLQNFLFTEIADVEHTWFNAIASWCAISLALGLAICALLSRRFAAGQRTEQRSRVAWSGLLLLALAAFLLMFPFTDFLWMHLPKLRFVQFPWRWMSIVALVYCCFVAAVAEKRRGWIAAAVILTLSVPLGYALASNGWWDPDEMPALKAAVTSTTGFDGTDEYDPLGDDHSDLPANAPPVKVSPEDEQEPGTRNAEVRILGWSTEHKVIEVDAARASRVAVRLLNYPAWQVGVNGRAVAPDRMDDVNQMVVPVPAGKSRIEIRLRRTRDRTAGNLLSLLSLGVLGVLLAGKRRANPTLLPQKSSPS